jgi:outer membrane protein assembly factor BamB
LRCQKIQLVLAFVGCLVFSGVAMAEDWPQWLGPRGDGISHETGLIDQWPKTGLKKLWDYNVGIGYSSPIAANGIVYFFATVDKTEVLYAFDAAGGKEIWKQTSPGGWLKDRPGPRATPLIDGDLIYTYGGEGALICRKIADGSPVWDKFVLKIIGGSPIQWGQSSSPLIVDKLIVVQGGKGGPAAAAFDKATGELVWKSAAKDGAYAHPILINAGKTPQLIIFAADTLYSLNPTNGQTIWSVPWKTKYDVNAATPIYRDGHLFITSSYDHGCMMLEVSDTAGKKLWENKSLACKFQPPILDGDVLYGSNGGKITCLSWPDGTVKWSADKDKDLNIGDGGMLVRVGDRLIALSDSGKLLLLKATPTGVEKISQVDHFVEGSEIWSMPLIYQGRLYVKGKEILICCDLSGK